jgi:hypothetical protein
MDTNDKAKIAALRLWLDQGWPIHRLESKAADLWQMTADETGLLIAEIRKCHSLDLDIEKQDFLAQQMLRLEALAIKAQEEGNLAVALGCYKELHALARLHV